LSLFWIFVLLNYLYADVIALFAIVGSRTPFEPLPKWALAGGIVTLVNGFLTFVPPLVGWGRPPAFAEYLFFATIETVCTSVIIWRAWTWSAGETVRMS
jgi:hypothetical protein